MTLQTKIYIGLVAAAIFVAAILIGTAWSNYKIGKLERTVEETEQLAEASRRLAEKKELEAAEYKQKIDYLERQLSEIQNTKRRQDEKLEKLNFNSGRARRDVERAKRTRAIDTTDDELCAKLADVGHPCE